MSNFVIQRDRHDRLCAEVAEGITVGLRVFSETDSRRLRYNTYAYAVVDFDTPLGQMRSRGIEVRWSVRNNHFYVKWPQQQFGKDLDNGRPDMLDVVGPRFVEGRENFEKLILELFHQVQAEAKDGKDFPVAPEDPHPLEMTLQA